MGSALVVIVSMYLVSLLFIRTFIWGVEHYQLNNSAYKKRKKGQTFKEWLLYSRFREEIPKILLILYFVVVWIHPLGIICCIILYSINPANELGYFVVVSVISFDCAWIFVILLLFWTSKNTTPYSRWIKKRRGGQNKKK
ncbi:MAG: hypothetical protein VB064_08215 [Oscillospiraceae bacterium]|nr:hypothetical protein [Oscillospiraceae bacterium]